MKSLGRVAAFVGLVAAVWLISREHPASVLALLRVGGFGLAIAALVHVVPMFVNAYCWETLILPRPRPGILAMLHIVWVREAVNGLLPVARIGGELVSFRFLRRRGVQAPVAAASLVGDMQLALLSQILFICVGVGILFGHSGFQTLRLAGSLAWGIAILIPVALAFASIQNARPFERTSRLLQRLSGHRLAELVENLCELEAALRDIWSQRGIVLRFIFLWQPLQALAVSVEFWLALRFMHIDISVADAIALQALIEALTSVAFFVPAGLGIQEAGLVVIGGALGLDPPACLALAGARRVRDLLVFLPGLVAWQIEERAAAQPGSLPSPGRQRQPRPGVI